MLKHAFRLLAHYRAEGAANGGWVVTDASDTAGRFASLLGAFTTSDDLLT